MKKILILFAAAFLALVPAAAANENASEGVKTQTQTYSVSDFDGLDVSWIYRVELTKASECKVEVEAPDFVIPYLTVKVRGTNLILGVSGMPGDVRRKMEHGSYEVHAKVSMPELTRVEMSGASRMLVMGAFQTGTFSLELSGAASLKGLEMTANMADLECSGASKFQLEGHLKQVKLDLSGASKATMESDGQDLDVDLSGSAKLDLTGVYDKADMELSAASNVHIKGALEDLRLSGSGAAKVDLMECPVKYVSLQLSGASSARIVALETLGVHLSGASSCHYKAGDNLKVTETDVDRGASLRKL